MLKIEIGGFKVRVSFWLCAFVAAALAAQSAPELFAFAAAAALHEAAHLLCLAAVGVRSRSLTLSLGRFEIDAPLDGLSFFRELAVLLSGAALNLSLALLLRGRGVFARANIMLGALNLLPAAHLDGGRALALILGRALGERAAGNVTKILSFACGVAICAAGFLALMRGKPDPTALLFGVYIILGTLR